MTAPPDPLDALRPPVPVGAPVGGQGHPVIDTTSVVAAPGRLSLPPAPLAMVPVVDDDDVLRAATPAGPTRTSPLVTASLLALAVALAGVALLALTRGDDQPDQVAGGAPTPVAAPPPSVVIDGVGWGVVPDACPTAQPCYTVRASFARFPPATSVRAACVVEGVERTGVVDVSVDTRGTARAVLPCPEARRARALAVEVDGDVLAEIPLPTEIEPVFRPLVVATVGRAAADQPGCSDPSCRFVDVALSGLEPGSVVTVDCNSDVGGPFGGGVVTIRPDGTAELPDACYFGWPGERFWVDAAGVSSVPFPWPEE